MRQYSDEFIALPNKESESEDSASDVSDNEISYSEEENESDSEEENESDSEPECISFSTSLEKKRHNQKIAAQALKIQKDDLKRKRKEVLLQNVKQREEKVNQILYLHIFLSKHFHFLTYIV